MKHRRILGILGGMGPLASTEFLRTIYQCSLNGMAEQEYPDVLLISYSSAPDRTCSLQQDEGLNILNHLKTHLSTLIQQGADRVVVCCFTSISVFHLLPDELRSRIISLTDIISSELLRIRKPALLLASQGSYCKEIFEGSMRGSSAFDYLVIPTEEDKAVIHRLIYDILKTGGDVYKVHSEVTGLMQRYGASLFIAGCTEFHLLTKHLALSLGIETDLFIDPLFNVARDLKRMLEKDAL